MAYISKAKLQQLKESVSLLMVAESQGHVVKKQGKDAVLLCPFHKEKTPSMVISPEKNLYHCFGCDAAGSVLDWVMQTEHLDYKQALRRLLELAGQQGVEMTPASGLPESCAAIKLVDVDADGQALIGQVVEFYHQTLLNTPEIQAFLLRRGLDDPDMLAHFKLGYSNASLSRVFPSTYSNAGRQMRQRLAALGILRPETRQEHFKGCFVVPVMGATDAAQVAHRGRVLQLYGRRTVADYHVKKGSSRHLYLPSPLAGVWNEEALIGSDV